jgi:hypothetical protein
METGVVEPSAAMAETATNECFDTKQKVGGVFNRHCTKRKSLRM